MTAHLLYSVLTYRHNHIANEQVNVGVLAVFPDNGEVFFLLPEHVALKRRLLHLYPDAAHNTVWGYLKSFDKQAERISGKLGGYLGNFGNLVSEQFLTDNGSSLQFSALEAAPLWKSHEESLALLQHRFLSGYGAVPKNREVVYNEAYIARQVKHLITDAFSKVKGKDVQLYLKEEKVEIKAGAAKITAPQQWKNGTLNLIHPLSLDLKTSDIINNKCLSLSKSAELLSGRAKEDNLCFHVVVSAPQDSSLKEAYEESVAVLEAGNDDVVKVYRPESWEKYAKEVVKKAVALV